LGLIERLLKRRQITFSDYEKLHEGMAQESLEKPRKEFALTGIDNQGYRHYEFIE